MSPDAALVDAILRDALAGLGEGALFESVCERLVAAGVPLQRAAIACDFLDPKFDSHGARWLRGQGTEFQAYERTLDGAGQNEWVTSPFYTLVQGSDASLRRRLDVGYRAGEYPVLDEFRGRGATDYVAMIERTDDTPWVGETRGIVVSWMTDAQGGFDDAAIDLIASVMPALATTFLARTMQSTMRALLSTYLGSDAADRVLAGNVIRGRAETLRTVVWFADLVGFTRIADTHEGAFVLAMLNEYAECEVEAIEAHGGHVLKFIGDGLLAIFPGAEESSACIRALDAAIDFRRRIGELNARRAAEGLPVSDAHVALHVGEVLYGNVGSPRRLDFTVLGSAVNEAARIEALCGSLDQHVVVSNAFAEAAGEAKSRLVSLGRYAMKGVAKPQEMFTLDPG